MVGGFFRNREVKMFAYLWPIALVMIANIIYQVSAKEVPKAMDAFASLTICYGIATVMTLVFFFIFALTEAFSLIALMLIELSLTAFSLTAAFSLAVPSAAFSLTANISSTNSPFLLLSSE